MSVQEKKMTLKEDWHHREGILSQKLVATKDLNPTTGVVAHEIASLKPVTSSPLKGCEEFAVIGFWDYDKAANRHKCQRYFFVPYPLSRQVKESKMNTVHQLLFTGKNDEVFFFFENNYQTKKMD